MRDLCQFTVYNNNILFGFVSAYINEFHLQF